MNFDYFYNRDTERFSFYMLPKVLVTEDLYKNLSSDAKILYACLLERSSLSFKNDWIDEQGRVYIVFTVEEIMKTLFIAEVTDLNSNASSSGNLPELASF